MAMRFSRRAFSDIRQIASTILQSAMVFDHDYEDSTDEIGNTQMAYVKT